jgi:hypothetical protein
MNELYYHVPGETWALQFHPAAVAVLTAHAQISADAPEAVGQLYSRDLTAPFLLVEHATKLQPTSASRTKVKFDPKLAFEERKAMFSSGLHCVGLWHTHPEQCPTPSREDKTLVRDYAKNAIEQVPGIVFAIVGTLPYPQGLRIWFDNGTSLSLAKILPPAL